MSGDNFDLRLMEDLEWLPPESGSAYTPWWRAVTCILWGLFLLTVRFEFLYLQYLLPFLGSMLVYLGFRTLRRENRWFRLCWGLSAALLLWQMVYLVGLASPASRLLERPVLNGLLTVLTVGADLLLMVSLRQGVRRAFRTVEGGPPPDFLGLGLLAYVGDLAIAVWSELVPLARMSEGPISFLEITNKPLYYGRTVLFLALHILLLWCIYRQGKTLEGRGYHVTPAPVRVSGGPLLLLCALLTAALLLPTLRFSQRVPDHSAPVDLTVGAAERQALTDLGMDGDLAAVLSREELDRCAGALALETLPATYFYGQDPVEEGERPLYEMDGGRLRLSCQAVLLPEAQVRYYLTYRWEEPPRLRLQESLTSTPSPRCPAWDFAAGRLGPEAGTLPVELGGGQTAEELPQWAQEWYSGELEALGHLAYVPGVTFSLPAEGGAAGGWLAWTVDLSGELSDSPEEVWLSADVIYRHQAKWLSYPFYDMEKLTTTGRLVYLERGTPVQSGGCAFQQRIHSPWK